MIRKPAQQFCAFTAQTVSWGSGCYVESRIKRRDDYAIYNFVSDTTGTGSSGGGRNRAYRTVV
jgi:hypothetical protein